MAEIGSDPSPVLVYRWLLGRQDQHGVWQPGHWIVLPGVCPPDDGAIGASFSQQQYLHMSFVRANHEHPRYREDHARA